MKKIKAIIVDDEASARENLELLIQRFCLQVNCVGTFNNLEKAVRFLKNHKVDLVFLDVDMPYYAGYEIVNLLEEIDFQIVFVTAYDQFALKAFEISAVDYLLKPIDIERLKDAIHKVEMNRSTQELANKYQEVASLMDKNREPKVTILEKGSRVYISFNEIIAVEAQAAYSWIHTASGQKHLYSKNISSLEKEFEGYPTLFRAHKSWIINTKWIVEYKGKDGLLLLKNDIHAKLSRYKVGEFKALIG